ncbi:MAG TPA: LOG family protein [Anaerolineales bacterium]|nr:LOG family protein [Anaerolineales bacterium]
MRITVFGGSAPKPGSNEYQDAYQLGKLIGKNGHTILTGGYIGTMEAASQGCAEAGGHVIGVTCDEIENWRPVKPNQWVAEEMRFPTVHQRLLALIENCDAAFALPGGVGTLAEIAMMWSQLQTQAIPLRPLILIGSGWADTFQTFIHSQDGYVPPAHLSLVTFAPDIPQAFARLAER